MQLLSRDEFRKQVFERDNYKCVICGEKAFGRFYNEFRNSH